jgi:hypothetical protein
MSNSNPLLDNSAIQEYFSTLHHSVVANGRKYYFRQRVSDLSHTEPGVYEAVVEGTMTYDITLEFDGGEWFSDCSCPMGVNCKHSVAALLAFQNRAADFSKPANAPKAKAKAKKAVKPPPDTSLLDERLAAVGTSKLNQNDVYQLGQIKSLFKMVKVGRQLTIADLRCFSLSLDYSWTAIKLWDSPPQSDLELWQFIAWELKNRRIAWPPFLVKITDISAVDEKINARRRVEEIEQWRQQLAVIQPIPKPKEVEAIEIDVQLVFGPTAAELYFRKAPQTEFVPVTSSKATEIENGLQEGLYFMGPEATLLWGTLPRGWMGSDWSTLLYSDSNKDGALKRILNNPQLVSRTVSLSGKPLARPEKPLRLVLKEPATDSGNYELYYVNSIDVPIAHFTKILRGTRSLYLVDDIVYHGPTPHGLSQHASVTIPAPALETTVGLNCLSNIGIPLPKRISEKTRIIKSQVHLHARIQESYPNSKTDYANFSLEATGDGLEKQILVGETWHDTNRFISSVATAKTKSKTEIPAPTGIIAVADRSAQALFPEKLYELSAKFDGYSGAWRMRITKTFPDLFAAWLKTLPPEVILHLDNELATLNENAVAARVRLDVTQDAVDWFDLQLKVDVDDLDLTEEEIKLLLNARGNYVKLTGKGWKRLDYDLSAEEDEQLARLGISPYEFSAEPQRFHALQLADDAATRFLPADKVADIKKRASELKASVTPAVPASIQATMRPYQIEGYHFLAYLSTNRFGGILADDMGLGKTLQALAWLAWLREQKDFPDLPSLVVCPKSVMANWPAEAARFMPGYRVRLWQGEPVEEMETIRKDVDLLVLNYSQMRNLSPGIAAYHWHVAILDEAQYIKNPSSQTSQAARALQADHRLALSGTPIENRLMDLWSIMAFAMPGVLGNQTAFGKRYNQEHDPLARRRLASRVRPFLLRRTKSQVARDLPERIEEDVVCELEGDQKTLYQAEYKHARAMLLKMKTKQDLNENRFHFLTSLLRLRQICCHPALVNEKLKKSESAKVNALLDLLEPLMAEGHKVLVFSQFVTMLDILRGWMKDKEWQHFYLAGDTEDRGALVESFQKAEGSAVFLISLKAGGFGLNLTAASYVVLFDPWWNPAVESQAIDRTHRIGQVNTVIAYRLLIKETIEQKIRQLQKTKAAIAEDVLGEESFARSLTLEDLQYLFQED